MKPQIYCPIFIPAAVLFQPIAEARHKGGSVPTSGFPACGTLRADKCFLNECFPPDAGLVPGTYCYEVNLCNDHHDDIAECDDCCESIDLCRDYGDSGLLYAEHLCDYNCALTHDLLSDEAMYSCEPNVPIDCCFDDSCGSCANGGTDATTLLECIEFLGGPGGGSYRERQSGQCVSLAVVGGPGGPPSGGAMDDPHFRTWAGTWYDYMGACDLHLVHAPKFVALGSSSFLSLTIDIRTTVRYFYSYIANAVVKIGNETLEVASFGDYYLNGIGSAGLPSTISGFPINHTQPSEHVHLFEIKIEGQEVIKLKTFKDMVSVMVEKADEKRFHGSIGMMGEYGTGRLLARDGANVIEGPNEFAAEWQVRSQEPMLFQAIREPQHPQQCLLPQDSKKPERRLGSLEAAKKACAHWSKETMQGCIHDVTATGDVELARAGPF